MTKSSNCVKSKVTSPWIRSCTSQKFAPQGAGLYGGIVRPVDLAGGDRFVDAVLQPPGVVQHPAKVVQISAGEDRFRLIYQREHFQKLLLLGPDGLLMLLLDGEGKPGKSGKEEHQVVVEPLLPPGGNDDGVHLKAILGEGDLIEAAVGRRDLVLDAAAFAAQLPLQVDGFLRQALFIDVLSLYGIEGQQHRRRKGTACPQAGPGGQISIVGEGQLPHIQEFHGLPDGGVLDLIYRDHPLPFGIGDLVVVLKKRRQVADMDIAVFIDAGGDDPPAVLFVKGREIGPAAKERHPERGLCDDHGSTSFLPGEELFPAADPPTPIIQQVLHGFLVGDPGFPAGMLFELAAVRHLEVGVDGAQTLRVLLHPDQVLFRGHPDEGMEGIPHGTGVPAADVVVLAGNGVHRHQHIIGANGVPDIGVGAQGVQIAHLHHRRDHPLLDHGDLLGKGGFVEHIPPAGPGVGEHPGGHNGHAEGLRVIPAHQIGADLGNGVGGSRVEGAVLMDALGGFYFWRDLAEHLGGGADMDNRLAPGDAQGLQKVTGADNVGVQSVDRGVKTGLWVALGRQVEHIIRLDLLDDGEQGDQVVEVGVPEENAVLVIGALEKVLDIIDRAAPAADAVDVPVGILQQVVRQVGTDHTGNAGDEGFDCHFLSPLSITLSIRTI